MLFRLNDLQIFLMTMCECSGRLVPSAKMAVLVRAPSGVGR